MSDFLFHQVSEKEKEEIKKEDNLFGDERFDIPTFLRKR